MMIVVPFCVLINDFIAMWVGAEYILPASVVVLLVMDLYIHFVHSVNVDFIKRRDCSEKTETTRSLQPY